MKFIYRPLALILLFVTLVLPFAACGGGAEGDLSILFVGNSFVYTGDLPKQLQTIARQYDVRISYKDISTGGATLGGSADTAIQELQTGGYDYVVLQDQSARPHDSTQNFLDDVQRLCAEAEAHGTTPVLYNPARMDYAGQPIDEVQETVNAAYIQAARENGVLLVDAANAWLYAYETVPGISLFASDNAHPNDAGAFYTACLFASALFDLHVQDIPRRGQYRGDDAVALGQAAWDYVQSAP